MLLLPGKFHFSDNQNWNNRVCHAVEKNENNEKVKKDN